MFDLHHRWAAQVPVGVVAVAEGQAVDTAVGLVINGPVVEEPTNASTLCLDASVSAFGIAG